MTTEERMNHLERTNRRLTMALVLVGMATIITVAAGMGPAEAVPNVVKARSFVLVDENGKERATLSVTRFGTQLTLVDENGKAGPGLVRPRSLVPALPLWTRTARSGPARGRLRRSGPGSP